MNNNNKQIAKNTLFMYLRMGVTMLVGLYVSRIVLQQLGVEDYGLYNVIGGIIAMFSFINGSMVNVSTRFITVYLAKNDTKMLNNIFSMSFLIHFSIGVVILLLGETIGLWYLNNKLVIPEGREFAAHWLYQLSIISCILSILYVPYNGLIVAHERMKAFAYISVMDSMLKLLIAIMIAYSPFDKLIFYGTLLAGVSFLDIIIYFVYCRKNFKESILVFYWNKAIFKRMLEFAGWALIGNFSYLFYSQGINLMLNAFCGPAVNAARGVAVQVEGVIRQFAGNVQVAINPQIIKSYTSNELERMYALIFTSSRLCFYLLYIISLPIMIEADFILNLWLGTVPNHTVNFVRLILCISILDALINPMFTANLACGKLKIYHMSLSILMYAFMFVTYFSIRQTLLPESVFVTLLIATILGVVLRIFILEKQIGLSKLTYIHKVLLPIISVAVISCVLPITSHLIIDNNIARFFISSLLSIISVLVTSYYIGMDKTEKQLVISFVKNKILKR